MIDILKLYLALLAAFGSIMMIWVTIRSRWFRYRFDSAKLKMSEETDTGHRVNKEGQDRTWFHIKITNASNRRYVPARDVNVICTAIERFHDNDFIEEYIPGEFPLQWVYSRKPPIPAIYVQDSVDLGFMFEDNDQRIFRLAMSDYQEKWLLPIEICSGDSGPSKMRVHLRMESDGFVSRNELIYEIDLSKDSDQKLLGKMPIARLI